MFSEETVARCVEDSYERIGDRPTVGPNFTPMFVEQFARERLQAVAQADGLVAKALPEVLFVCDHNAGRSQIAAALAHQLSDGAGLGPLGRLETRRSASIQWSWRRCARSGSTFARSFPSH